MALAHVEIVSQGIDKEYRSAVVDFGGMPLIGVAALAEEATVPELDYAPTVTVTAEAYSGQVATGSVVEVS